MLIQQGSRNECFPTGYYVQTTVNITSGICLEDWFTGECKGSPCTVIVHQEWSLPSGNTPQLCHVFLGRKFCLDPPPSESSGSNDYEQNLACNDLEHAYTTSGDTGACGRLESLAKVKCTSCQD